MADGRTAHIKALRQIIQSNTSVVVLFNETGDLVQKLRLFCLHGAGGAFGKGALQIGQDRQRVTDDRHFPTGTPFFLLLDAVAKEFPQEFPPGAHGADEGTIVAILMIVERKNIHGDSEKFLADPYHIPLIGFGALLR